MAVVEDSTWEQRRDDSALWGSQGRWQASHLHLSRPVALSSISLPQGLVLSSGEKVLLRATDPCYRNMGAESVTFSTETGYSGGELA